ncbi:MAG: hypothetical protein LBR22_07665 [Desulfovibrio sp.]|nr:hypothetical protein [Desulfovibrio sp.]
MGHRLTVSPKAGSKSMPLAHMTPRMYREDGAFGTIPMADPKSPATARARLAHIAGNGGRPST